MKRLAAAAVALFACGACGARGVPAPVPVATGERADAAVVDASADAGDALPSLDAIAARAATAVRGMREAARGEVAGGALAEIARADARDLCARVAYAATSPVIARIEDGAGAVLAERTGDAEGFLAARGPVCVKKGGALRVTFGEAPSTKVRFVAWVAP